MFFVKFQSVSHLFWYLPLHEVCMVGAPQIIYQLQYGLLLPETATRGVLLKKNYS